MTTRSKQVAAATTAAVALASGAYALGSQAGGGSAEAQSASSTQKSPPRGGRDCAPGPRVDALASRLGVEPAKLRAALAGIRQDSGGPAARRADLAKTLAGDLGVPVEKVTAALEKLRPGGPRAGRRAGFVAALAAALGKQRSEVRAALRENRPESGPGGPPPSLDGLAKALGVSTSKLQAALLQVGPPMWRGGGPGGPPGPGGPIGLDRRAAALAKELGVDEAKVTASLQKFRAARRQELASALAKRLGLDESKVLAAIDSLPHDGPGDRP